MEPNMRLATGRDTAPALTVFRGSLTKKVMHLKNFWPKLEIACYARSLA